jgi:hypothetical protein
VAERRDDTGAARIREQLADVQRAIEDVDYRMHLTELAGELLSRFRRSPPPYVLYRW